MEIVSSTKGAGVSERTYLAFAVRRGANRVQAPTWQMQATLQQGGQRSNGNTEKETKQISGRGSWFVKHQVRITLGIRGWGVCEEQRSLEPSESPGIWNRAWHFLQMP